MKDEEVWITFGEQEKRVFLAKVREIIAGRGAGMSRFEPDYSEIPGTSAFLLAPVSSARNVNRR